MMHKKSFRKLSIVVITLFFCLYCHADISLRLKLMKGWNLVSLPVIPKKTNPEVFFNDDKIIGNVWEFVDERYEPAAILEPYHGYWVYAEESFEIFFQATESEGYGFGPKKTENTWFLFGVSSVVNVPKSIDVFAYEKSTFKKVKEGEPLFPFKGYFVFNKNTEALDFGLTNEDFDNDDVPDYFEVSYNLNYDSSRDRLDDPDFDGLPNFFEFLSGTNPKHIDSDRDGLRDGEEEARNHVGASDVSIQNIVTHQTENGILVVDVTLGNRACKLILTPFSLRSKDFQLFIQSADGSLVPTEPSPICTFRGTVDGTPSSFVVGSVVDGQCKAKIRTVDGTMWNIHPLPGNSDTPNSLHAVFQEADIVANEFSCGVDDDIHGVSELFLNDGNLRDSEENQNGIIHVAELAIDTDYELFIMAGKTPEKTLERVEDIVNKVSEIYEREVQIRYVLSAVIIRPFEPDPYYSLDTHGLLVGVRNFWNEFFPFIRRDATHLLSGKKIFGPFAGRATIGTICDISNAYGVSLLGSNQIPDQSIRTLAHELGHNWGSYHCDGYPDCFLMCSGVGGRVCSGISQEFGLYARNGILLHRVSRICLNTTNDPDLIVEIVSLQDVVVPLHGIELTIRVRNIGGMSISDPFPVDFWLSPDGSVMDGFNDALLDTVMLELIEPLHSGKSQDFDIRIEQIPNGVAIGEQQVVVCIDLNLPGFGTVNESNEHNNCASAPIQVAETDIAVVSGFALNTPICGKDFVHVNYTVSNNGPQNVRIPVDISVGPNLVNAFISVPARGITTQTTRVPTPICKTSGCGEVQSFPIRVCSRYPDQDFSNDCYTNSVELRPLYWDIELKLQGVSTSVQTNSNTTWFVVARNVGTALSPPVCLLSAICGVSGPGQWSNDSVVLQFPGGFIPSFNTGVLGPGESIKIPVNYLTGGARPGNYFVKVEVFYANQNGNPTGCADLCNIGGNNFDEQPIIMRL